MESLRTLGTRDNAVTKFVGNDYVLAIGGLLAVAYVTTFAPKLPSGVANALDNIVVKFIVFFIIAYIISRKADVALIATLAVIALVLGLQVYMTDDKAVPSLHTEKMTTGGFLPHVESRQAEVNIDAKGNFMENEPLNAEWTLQKGEAEGYRLDWPGYENVVDSVTASTDSASSASVSTVVASNDAKQDAQDGEIVGVSGTDMSNHGTL